MTYCYAKNLSKKTMKSYELTLRLFEHYLEKELNIKEIGEISKSHIRNYVSFLKERGKYTYNSSKDINNNPAARNDYGKELSPNTINNYLRNLKVFFNWLVEEEEIIKNPANKVPYLKKQERIKELLTEDEVRNLISTFDITTFHGFRNKIITLIILDTGVRITECLTLEVEDIDLVRKIILVKNTKNKKERYVYFSLNFKKELVKWLRFKDRYLETNLLFPSNRGNVLAINTYEKALRDVGKSLGNDLYPHRIRANFAQYYLLNGGDLISLSKILGHSDIEVTKVYLQFDDKTLSRHYQKFSPLSNMNF